MRLGVTMAALGATQAGEIFPNHLVALFQWKGATMRSLLSGKPKQLSSLQCILAEPKYGNRTRTPRYVADEITETLRVKRRMKKGDNVKVYAFVWYDVFSPPCAQYENCTQIFSSQDFQTEFHSPLQEGVDGLVIWGSSGDVNSAAKCANMETYVGGVLGPFLKI